MASLKRRSVKFKTERDGERTEVASSTYGIVFVAPTRESSPPFNVPFVTPQSDDFQKLASLAVRKAERAAGGKG